MAGLGSFAQQPSERPSLGNGMRSVVIGCVISLGICGLGLSRADVLPMLPVAGDGLAAGAGVEEHQQAEQPSLRTRGLARYMHGPCDLASGSVGGSIGVLPGAIPQCIKAPGEFPPPGWIDEPFGVMAPADESVPMAACFDRKSPPSLEVQEALDRMVRGALADRFVLNNSWPGANNVPITLTWSFVPDGTSIPGSPSVGEPTSNSMLFSAMDSRFGVMNRAVWIGQIQACFDRWAALTGTSYTRVTNNGNLWDDGASFPNSAGSNTPGSTRGDIRIGAHPIDGNGGILAYNFYPTGGDMVLDANETWNFGAPAYIYLRNTVMHEHGHGLGLNHVCPADQTKLMEPFISTEYDGPRQDDLRAAQYSYGDAYESNNTQATASNLGVLALGATLNPSTPPGTGLAVILNGSLTSISLDADQDWYLINISSPMIGSLSLVPVGSNYADYVQDSQCSNTSPNFNSLNQADLVLDLINASGTTIATANLTSFGGSEALNNILLSPPGNLYVRVRENNSPIETQLYTLTITANSAPVFSASDGAFTDRVRLNWNAVTGASTYAVYRGVTSVRASATLFASPSAPAIQFDDFSTNTSTTYFYWLEANTGTGLRPVSGPETGFRGTVTAPTNDVCSSAIAVASGSTATGTLVAASNDATATCGGSSTNGDVWYTFTASCAGNLTVSTCGTNDTPSVDSGIDTVISLWSACPGLGGIELACNDTGACAGFDSGNQRDASLTRALAQGEGVRIRVSRFSTSAAGAFTLRVAFDSANDNCNGATPAFPGVPVSFCNIAATTDGPAEPACLSGGSSQISSDLWFRYTPLSSGRWTVQTCGSTFDTRLAVYPNCPVGAGTVLACADDTTACGPVGSVNLQTSLSVVGQAGASVLVRVGGSNGATGNGTFTIFCAGDYNLSGGVSLQDVFDFLDGYFMGESAADINASGSIGTQDIFDYLGAFFGGC